MKKHLTILMALLVAALFTAVNVSAYDYIYGDTRPDDSFYFTDRGTHVGSDYDSGDYITGVKDVVAGDVIEFDVNISGITSEFGGYLSSYFDLMFTKNLSLTSVSATYDGMTSGNAYSDWAYFNNPDSAIWDAEEGFVGRDQNGNGRTGDIAVIQINVTAETIDPYLLEADGALDVVWHWSAGVEGDVLFDDSSSQNVVANPSTYKYAHQAYPGGQGDLGCRLLVNPVPIPGALWLIGSAFLCILGINKKRG